MKIKKQKINILLVEDSEASSILIQSIFEEYNSVFVDTSKTASAAFNKLKKQKFDLILLDLMLPRIDGFTFLKKIKKNDKMKKVPVIVVSALNTPENIALSEKLGANMFISKPIGNNKLFDKVTFLLKDIYNFQV